MFSICAPATDFTSRGQFPGFLTFSCNDTIPHGSLNFHKSVTSAKNTAQTQKSPPRMVNLIILQSNGFNRVDIRTIISACAPTLTYT